MALPTPPLYDDTSLGLDLSRGAVGGSQKPTRLIRMPSGREQRVKLWAGSKKHWTLPFDMRPLSQADTLVAFWEARDGGQRAFRFRDPAENAVIDQALTPDGSPYVQLIRQYSSGSQTRTKNIFAPVVGTVTLKKNGSNLVGFTLVYTTGVVTLPVVLQKSITAISQASAAVLTVGAAHGFAVNDKVAISGVSGMTEINNLVGTVSATAATTITLGGASGIDSSNFSAYVSGGLATKYLTTTDTLTWTGTHDYVARFEALQQEMVHDDAFIRSWSVPLVEVTQGSGEVTLIDPVSLPGLEVYLRSDQIVGTNGTGAATFPDIGGSGRDATQATAGQRPIITDAASPNGKRMLLYDGVDDQMAGTLPALPTGVPNTDGYTCYFYFKEAALTTGGFNSQLLLGGTMEMVARTATIGGYPSDQAYGIAFNRQSLGPTTLGFQTFTAVWRTGGSPTMAGYVNGVQSGATLVWNNATWGNGYTLGSNAGGNVSLSGLLGAMVVFSHAHDDATRAGVEAFLKNYFEG